MDDQVILKSRSTEIKEPKLLESIYFNGFTRSITNGRLVGSIHCTRICYVYTTLK